MTNLLKTSLLFLAFLTTCVMAQTQETVYLQTDRPSYVSGETLFFKLSVLDAATKKPSDLSKVGYIELRAPKSEPVLKIRVAVSAGVATGSVVLTDSLHSDVYQFVAFTAFMKNVGESSYFHRELVIANRLDKDLNIRTTVSADTNSFQQTDSLLWLRTDKAAYLPGEKVTLHLGSAFSKANLAVSVYEVPKGLSLEKSTIETLRSPSLKPSAKALGYLVDKPSKILRGRVLDAVTNQRVQDAIVLLSCSDSVANLQYAVTNQEGLFQLQLSPYYDGKELFFSLKEMPADQNWKIVVEDNFDLSEPWKPDLRAVQPSTKDFLSKSQDIAYINKIYASLNVEVEKASSAPQPFVPLLYRRPVKSIRPSEYVTLDSFPEIAVELLPSIKLTKQDGVYHVRTITREQQFYGRNDATVFLDGVYLDDLHKIIPLGSENIRKIDVLEDKRAMGDIVFFGIISIQSNSNEILKTVPGPHSLRLKNDTVTVGKSSYDQRPPASGDARTPFYKQLLYWNPAAAAQTDQTFFTSENTGDFIIKAEGFAEDGTPLSAITRIQVNNPTNATEK
jgi:hypothetical protein